MKNITVSGFVENFGSNDPIALNDIKFVCGAEFLRGSYMGNLKDVANDPGDGKLSPGEQIAFYVDLGGPMSKTRSTKGSFNMKYDDTVNDKVPIDVTKYYE